MKNWIGALSLILAFQLPSSSQVEEDSIPGVYLSIASASKVHPDSVFILHLYNLDIVPKEVYKYRNLKEFRFCNSKIRKVPVEVCQLKNLEVLDFDYCHDLKEIPEKIGSLVKLKRLSFLMSQVTAIPQSICGLTMLESLNLSYCRVKNFPECFFSLKNLKSLCVGFSEAKPPLFTEAELKELKGKLPDCKIYY